MKLSASYIFLCALSRHRDTLDGIIARHRKRLSALPNPETSDEAYKIKTLLNVLYKERRDVLETANYLKDNYSGEENR